MYNNLYQCIIPFSEFELNLVVVFKEDYTVSENFKIVLKRSVGTVPYKITTAGR